MDAPHLVGPQFADVQPQNAAGALTPTVYTVVNTSIQQGTIVRVTPYTAFLEGQDIIFWLDVTNKVSGANFIDLIILKLWWLRPNVQFRTPGDPAMGGWLGGTSLTGTIDGTTFGGTTDANNRGVWIPETRGLTVIPPTSPARHMGYEWNDVVWLIRLGDPAADPVNGVSRRIVFGWKAYGRALGFTSTYTFSGQSDPGSPTVGVSYKTGWAGGSLVSQNAVI